MHIIIEGPDGSGKSTLARAIQDLTGYRIQTGEGPERYPGEITNRAMRWLTMMVDDPNIIFDRHPCVSHPIYSKYTGTTPLDRTLSDEVYRHPAVFIYCKGQSNLEDHEEKDYDSKEHVSKITEHHDDICRSYERWASERATVIFDRGRSGDVDRILSLFSVQRMMSDIESFHSKFGLHYDGLPRVLPTELLEFRNGFFEEETEEWFYSGAEANHHIGSLKKPEEAFYTDKLEGQLDGLVDLAYILLGTAHLQGITQAKWSAAWQRVHSANMKKIRALRADDSKRGSTFDVIKPPGWEAPKLTDLVEVNDFHDRVNKE